MSNPVLVKRSAVPGRAPTTAILPAGSLAMNTADARLFFSTGDIVKAVANLSDLTWGNIAGKPNTISGIGLTDAYTKSEVDLALQAKVSSSLINAVNGVAGLDSNGKLLVSQLPATAITDTFVVASQAAMLALTAQTGDVAVRTDVSKSFILRGASASTLADWQELLTPTDVVTSVNGMVGPVTISTITGNAGTATKLATARSISVSGDATGSANFDGSANAAIALTLANVVTAGTAPKVTFNSKGLITGSSALLASDIPALDWSKITTGLPNTLAGYGITDASDLVALQLRRTTTQPLTTTATDITFGTVDFANDTDVLTRGVTTSQAIAKVAGLYMVVFECETINTTSANLDLFQLKLNGVAVPQGLATVNCRSTRQHVVKTVILQLAANDYITVAASSNTGTSGTMQIGASLSVIRMQGLKGDKGEAGAMGGSSSLYYPAATFDNPNNASWAVNALAPVTADPANASLLVRTFDDTAEEGVGCTVYVPPSATSITFTFVGKCATAPTSVKSVVPRIYSRLIPMGSAVGAWSAATQLTALTIPTNIYYNTFTQTLTLASLGLTAGGTHQLEITRQGSNASDTLVGDFHMLNTTISFS